MAILYGVFFVAVDNYDFFFGLIHGGYFFRVWPMTCNLNYSKKEENNTQEDFCKNKNKMQEESSVPACLPSHGWLEFEILCLDFIFISPFFPHLK